MPHIRRVLPTAVLVLLLVGKAGAEQPPQLLPTRDVDIIYDVTLPSQPRVRERVRYLAAELLERVDGPHRSTTIFDRRTHEIIILTSANRTFLKLNMPRQPQEPGPKATLKRGNESGIAGLHCQAIHPGNDRDGIERGHHNPTPKINIGTGALTQSAKNPSRFHKCLAL